MEYTITFTLWQSWLFLFGVSLLGILIGFWICKTSFYKEFVDSYTRSRGKSEIGLNNIEVGFLKNLATSGNIILIAGGLKTEREGMIDYVLSHIKENIVVTHNNVKSHEYVKGLEKDLNHLHIVSFDGECNMLTFLANAHTNVSFRNVIFIEIQNGKSTATVYTYHKDSKRYSNIIEYISKENN